MALTPGARLGPYEILAPLGAGGMGEVYRARDTRLDREVAIKVLPEHLAQDPKALGRFEREAKAVAALSHPNILAIYDVGKDQGISYAVTELLEGETLRGRLTHSGLSPRKAIEISVAIADGLAAAHSKDITHRDLKPENIFLTSDGRVKILDFGLARWNPPVSDQGATADAPTESGTIMGTVGYMSPEQVRGEPVGAASDIFSLGCVLYEMVTGNKAFGRRTVPESMSAILRDDPPPLDDPELQRIVIHCLEKNPRERFQSAHDLGFALRSIGGETRRAHRLPRAMWSAAAAALLLVAVVAYWVGRPGQAIDSLAVLPFANVGGDANQEYLSDGITENLINSLSQIPKLRVVPRSLAFAYKGRETDPRKAGRELSVRAVLMGRVMQRGESLNIQAELVDVAEVSQLWGRQYERKFSEIIPVQEEIAKEVSEKLHLRPTGEEQKRLTKRYTENPEAHQFYLKGRYLWNRRTAETLKRAAEYFQQAIDKDPGYALAWAGLADCYAVYSTFAVLPPRDAIPKAKEAASKALAIDDTMAEPHATLAFVNTTYDRDWTGAEREFKKAIEINPNYSTAHHWYSFYLGATGRLDEAIAEAKLAQDADPLSLIISSSAGYTFHLARRYDQAIEQLRKTLEMDPNFHPAHWYLATFYDQVARYEDAIAECQKALSLGGDPGVLGVLGHVYAASGKRAEALRVLAELKDLSKRRYVDPSDIALVYVGLGDKPQALEWLEKAYEDRSYRLTWIKVLPQFDSLHRDPRFQDLLRRMGLPP